jgi:hypothetical protein
MISECTWAYMGPGRKAEAREKVHAKGKCRVNRVGALGSPAVTQGINGVSEKKNMYNMSVWRTLGRWGARQHGTIIHGPWGSEHGDDGPKLSFH